MYVRPSHRGRGHGQRILQRLEEHGRSISVTSVILETGIHNREAIALYEAAGYFAVPTYASSRDQRINRAYAKQLDARDDQRWAQLARPVGRPTGLEATTPTGFGATAGGRARHRIQAVDSCLGMCPTSNASSHEVAGVQRGEFGGLVGGESEPSQPLLAAVVHRLVQVLYRLMTSRDRLRGPRARG